MEGLAAGWLETFCVANTVPPSSHQSAFSTNLGDPVSIRELLHRFTNYLGQEDNSNQVLLMACALLARTGVTIVQHNVLRLFMASLAISCK